MTVYDPEGLLHVHAQEHRLLERAAYAHPTHPLHLGVLESVRRAKRRSYIHYTLRRQAVRHGVAMRRYA
jgi:hypothetical protein